MFTSYFNKIAWQGERINIEVVGNPTFVLHGPQELPTTIEGLYATTAGGSKVWDVIAPYKPGKTDKLWITIDIPRDAKPGFYNTEDGKIVIEVLPIELPERKDWRFHLDLWQNPWAVARVAGCEPWSAKHFEVLRRHLAVLADAGQKVITTTVVNDVWASQTYDSHGSMVKWISRTRRSHDQDPSFDLSFDLSFDFAPFEKYVTLCREVGIDGPIHVFSVLPWGSNQGCGAKDGAARYQLTTKVGAVHGQDETIYVSAEPGSDLYNTLWSSFLKEFVVFLREKGWEREVRFAFDERHQDEMMAALTMLSKYWPEDLQPIQTASAYEYDGEYADMITDLSVGFNTQLDWNPIAHERKSTGKTTTFYLCEHPKPPSANTFLVSPPHESRWVGWYAAANGFDGFLRWAYDSWPRKPFTCGDFPGPHGHWPAGDTFLCYPNGWKSRRLAMLRSGIQDYEKIRLLGSIARQILVPFTHQNLVSEQMMVQAENALGLLSQRRCHLEPIANLYLVRHADRFDSYPANKWVERASRNQQDPRDCPLSEFGHSQAAQLADFFTGKVQKVYSSPYLRTLQTANHVAEKLDLPINVEHGLSEGYHEEIVNPRTRISYIPRINDTYLSRVVCERREEYPAAFKRRITQTVKVFPNNEDAVFFSHAAPTLSLAAGLLHCHPQELGALAPGGVIHLRKNKNGYCLVAIINDLVEAGQTKPWGF